MFDHTGALLRERISTLFLRPIDEALPTAEFGTLALDLFRYQYERNPPYAAYCARRGCTPDSIADWTDIPPVPTTAFKHVALVSGQADAAEIVFRTSGTTGGSQRRGAHYLLDGALYRQALLPTFAAFMLPEGEMLPLLSLIPSAEELPDSSLAHMVSFVQRELGAPGSRCFATVTDGIDEAQLEAVLADARAPVCLLGTSFSFVNWLDSMAARHVSFRLPDGSRLMDTGGYKGSGREVSVEDMSRAYAERLGIEPVHCVNEYGMTELCSQRYDGQLRDYACGRAPRLRVKRAPPWLRTRVVDAESLRPVPDGTPGLLQHIDLANLSSVIAIQTEDIGVSDGGGGLQLLGRVRGAPPRGCSIAMDDLLRATGKGSS